MVVTEITRGETARYRPRLRAELERRVRELGSRFKPSHRDLRELASLREFLKVTPTKGQ